MKKIYTVIAGLMLTASVFAQAPEKMSYQAVVRNASNNLTTNQAVGMQISILQTTATGTAVYVETQTPTTNANGLVSLEIGTGTVVSGDFTTIDWANDTYFIKTETDPTGGTAYTITGTSQLMSVPYALHAKTAESITGTVNYTETDPIFGASIANGITALDTANWNNHSIDTDTQLDSTAIATLGYVAGAHTVDTDTQLDAAGVTALGFVAGAHTVDTDTQLDSTDIATLGYVAGAHTVDTDTQLDAAGVTALGFVAGAHTVDTDTQLDSTDIATLGYVAGAHTVDTDTQLDAAGVTALGFVAGAHTVDTDTQLDEAAVDGFVANNGYLTSFTEVDGSLTNEIQTISRTGTTVTLTNGGGTFTDSVNTYTAGTGIDITNNVISASGGSTHYVGELFGGGIVYYVYDNGVHGLIASLDDLDGGNGVAWSGNTATLIGATAQSFYDGASNTTAMVTQDATANKAGTLCDSYSNGGFSDWYLPANWELNLLYNSAYIVSNILANDANGTTQPLHPENVAPTYGRYWSSTEYGSNYGWYYSFLIGSSNYYYKTITYRVRAVRAF